MGGLAGCPRATLSHCVVDTVSSHTPLPLHCRTGHTPVSQTDVGRLWLRLHVVADVTAGIPFSLPH